jgi:hypothetical protein
MGLLNRLRGRDDDEPAADDVAAVDAADRAGGPVDDEATSGIYAVEEVGTRPLTGEEEAALDAVRAGYADHGIDPADLASIATAYDRALQGHAEQEDASSVVDLLGTAVGDHLVVAGGYRWVVSTDPFGSDLAVEPPRRGMPVVARMLVATRWMARESGWVPGVVGHLARAGRS